jgi:DNA-binding transcriptional ArsR family regulator
MPKAVNIFKAVSDPSRLRILKMLEIRELCVCEITEALGLSASTVSKHLFILRNAGLLWDRKDGKWVNYGLNNTSGHPLTTEILKLVREKINDDPVYQEDREKIRSTSREIICGIKT